MRKYEIHPFSLAVGGVVAVVLLFACAGGGSSSPPVDPDPLKLVSYHVAVTADHAQGWQAPVTISPPVQGGGLVITRMFLEPNEHNTANQNAPNSYLRLIENGNGAKVKYYAEFDSTWGSGRWFGDDGPMGLKFDPGKSVSIQLYGIPTERLSYQLTVVGYII